ncbi:hypothetical protein B0H14DRAFT_3424997 [Mycena olivaceomarginata]|nr:hypothetical protein B0H14DRAFT_3424997 [Mycena olivaceomarginata]
MVVKCPIATKFVCGASAGANLAAAVTRRSLTDSFLCKDRKIAGTTLQILALVHPAAYPPDENEDVPILTALMDVFYALPQILGSPLCPPPSNSASKLRPGSPARWGLALRANKASPPS